MANQPDRTGEVTVFNDADLAGIAVRYIVLKASRSQAPAGIASVDGILSTLEEEFNGDMVAHELFLTYSEATRIISVEGSIAFTGFTVGGFKTELIKGLKAFQALPPQEQAAFVANLGIPPLR